jgi:hypothetical protein
LAVEHLSLQPNRASRVLPLALLVLLPRLVVLDLRSGRL